MGNDDFVDLLNYLKQCNCIAGEEYQGLRDDIVRDVGLNLFSLVILFAGEDWAQEFMFSLPLNLQQSANLTDPEPDVDALIATDFVSSRGQILTGWKAIESISFKVAARQGTTLIWTFPTSQTSTFQLTHDRTVEVLIKWPAYSQRSVHGNYRGILQVGKDEYHVVGELSTTKSNSPQYSVKFSNENYDVKNYTSPVSVALHLFNARDFPFSKYVQEINIPGLDDVLKSLEDALPLNEVGFVLERTSSKMLLKEIAGTLPLATGPNSDWWPFKKTSFSVESLRVILGDIGSPKFRKVAIQLNGNMNDFRPAVPFRLSATLSEHDTAFEIAILPDDNGSLSIQNILDVSNVSSILDVGNTFPSVSSISNAFQISNASVGWGRNGINFLRLGIDIEEWNVLSGKFFITNLSFDIYATFPVQSKRFSLWGSGAIQIGGVDLGVLFDIELGSVAFRLATFESPLALKSIFEHFLGESETLLPQGLLSLLQETGIESVLVEGSHEGSSWSLSRFAIATSINTEFSIFENFSLSYPRLVMDVAYPFTKSKRTIDAAIGATVNLGETLCDMSITWAGENSSLTVAFEPRLEPLLLVTLISFFIPGGISSLSVPPSLSFLLGIGLADARLTLNWANGSFKLNELSATIVSSTSLELWKGLQLENLALHFAYSKVPGKANKSVLFSATLSFPQANLDFTLSYDGPTVSGSLPSEPSDTPEDTSITARPNNGEAWTATVTYAGMISVIDIMSTVSGIDISKELSSVGLSELRQLIDIKLSDLRLALIRKPDDTSFTFDANVKYLFFDGPVHLACSKSTTWLYTFTFGLSSEDFFSRLGIHGIALINSTIGLSNGPVMDSSLVNTTNNVLSVTFSGTLIFKDSLKQLGKVMGYESLAISGSVSSSSFTLAVATSQIPIFNDMLLNGRLLFSCSTGQLLLAVEGIISNINFPEISSETFSTTFSLFVKLPSPELGFQFTLDRLDNAFGIKGLQFKSILFRAAFQEFPVPSEVAFAGKLWFHIGSQQFYGSVAIYFSENDLAHSATMGHFETFPSVNESLEGFDSSGRTAPEVVNGTFADLEFSRALQAVRVGDIVVPQGLLLKGSLKLPSIGFDAFFEISIAPSRLHIAGDIKKAITVTVDNNRLFALTRASDSNRGPSLDLTIVTSSPPTCQFSGEIYLLGLSAAAEFELSDSGLSFHETISAWLAGVKIDFVIDKKYLDLSASCVLDVSLPSFKVGAVTISRVKVVKFRASLATNVHWEHITWELTITGTMKLGDWDMGGAGPFTLNADFTDFTKIAQRLAELIATKFGDLFRDEITKRLKEGLDQVVRELKAIGVIAKETTDLLVKEFGYGIEEVIKSVKEVFDLSLEKVTEILRDIGKTAEEVGRILKDAFDVTSREIASILKEAGYAVDDVGRVLNNVYGVASDQVASILKQAGYTVNDIGKVLKDVYGVASDQVASILKQAGYAVVDVGRVLKDVYGVAADQAALILKQAGYAVDDVGRVLNDVYGLASDQAASILKQVGYTINDIGRVLKDVYGVASDQVASILKHIGYAVNDVGRVLQDIYGVASDQAASFLKQAGYVVNDVAGVLENVFNLTAQKAGEILKDVGYAADDVNKVIGDAGNAIGDAANTVGGAIGDAANTVGGAVGDAANTVGGAVGDAANTLGDIGKKIFPF